MKIITMFAIFLLVVGLSGVVHAEQTDLVNDGLKVDDNVKIEDRVKIEDAVKNLPKDKCIDRLKESFPRLTDRNLAAKCDAIIAVNRKVDIAKALPRVADAVKTKIASLNDEEKNKLRLLTREQVERYSKLTPEQIRDRLKQIEVKKIYDEETGFKQRVLTKDRLEKLEQNQKQLQDQQNILEEGLDTAVKNFKRHKDKERECVDDDSEDCEDARTQAKEQAKLFLERAAKIQLKIMEQIRNRLEQNEDLTDEEISEILEDVELEENLLNEALDELSNAETKEEIKAAGEKIYRYWHKVKKSFALHEYQEYHSRVNGIFNQAKVMDRKLDRLLSYYEENNLDTSEIDSLVDEYSLLIEDAREKFADANELFKDAWILDKDSVSDLDIISSKIKEAKELIKSAQEDLKSAAEKLREIFKEVKDNRKILDKDEEDDYYDVEVPDFPNDDKGDAEDEVDDIDEVDDVDDTDDGSTDNDGSDDASDNDVCVVDDDCEEGYTCIETVCTETVNDVVDNVNETVDDNVTGNNAGN